MIFNTLKSLSDGQSLCSANRVVVQSHHPGPDCLRELESLVPLIKRAHRAEHSDFETFEFALFLRKTS